MTTLDTSLRGSRSAGGSLTLTARCARWSSL
jgi:hypothetical protein